METLKVDRAEANLTADCHERLSYQILRKLNLKKKYVGAEKT